MQLFRLINHLWIMEEKKELEFPDTTQVGMFAFLKVLGYIFLILSPILAYFYAYEFGYTENVLGYGHGNWDQFTVTIAIAIGIQSIVLGTVLIAFGKLCEIINGFIQNWQQVNRKHLDWSGAGAGMII